MGGAGGGEGGEEGPVVNQGALPGAGTRKSGEGRVGTGPNDSSTALYKYSRAGSARLPLLLAAKKPRHKRLSPSPMKLFDTLFIVDRRSTHRWRQGTTLETRMTLPVGVVSGRRKQSGDVQIFIQTEISLHTIGLKVQVKCPQGTNIQYRSPPTSPGKLEMCSC